MPHNWALLTRRGPGLSALLKLWTTKLKSMDTPRRSPDDQWALALALRTLHSRGGCLSADEAEGHPAGPSGDRGGSRRRRRKSRPRRHLTLSSRKGASTHAPQQWAGVVLIVVGVLVSSDDLESWQAVLRDLGYPSWEETSNPAYRIFLGS